MNSRRAVGLCAFAWPLVVSIDTSHAEPSDQDAGATSIDDAPPERSAKEAFDHGLALVREHRFREAIRAFEVAYSLKPHYAVSYNISQSYARLGDLDRAVHYLERCLTDGASSMPEPLRAERELQLTALKSQRDTAQAETGPSDPVPGRELPAESPSVEAPQLVVNDVPAAGRVAGDDASSPQETPPTNAASDSRRTAAYVTGATGLAFVGTSAGLFIWNHQQAEQWEHTNDELAAYRECYPSCLPPDDFNTRQTENNELSDSIQRVQIIAVSSGILGLGLIGASVYWASTRSDAGAPSTEVSLAPGFVHITRTW